MKGRFGQQVRRFGLDFELGFAVPVSGDHPERTDHLPLGPESVGDQNGDRVGLGEGAPVQRAVVQTAHLLA